MAGPASQPCSAAGSSASALAAQSLPDGTFASSKDGCAKLKTKTGES